MTIEEDTQVKPIPQETGKNNVKHPINEPQKPVSPIFNDKKYGGKHSQKTGQQFQQKEQEPSEPSGLLKSIPIIGGFLAKKIGSKFEKGNVEQVGDKKRVK